LRSVSLEDRSRLREPASAGRSLEANLHRITKIFLGSL
jgi:hypothetical protein